MSFEYRIDTRTADFFDCRTTETILQWTRLQPVSSSYLRTTCFACVSSPLFLCARRDLHWSVEQKLLLRTWISWKSKLNWSSAVCFSFNFFTVRVFSIVLEIQYPSEIVKRQQLLCKTHRQADILTDLRAVSNIEYVGYILRTPSHCHHSSKLMLGAHFTQIRWGQQKSASFKYFR